MKMEITRIRIVGLSLGRDHSLDKKLHYGVNFH